MPQPNQRPRPDGHQHRSPSRQSVDWGQRYRKDVRLLRHWFFRIFFLNEISDNVVFAALVYSDLITTIPFENTVDSIDLRGNVLKDVLEYGVSQSWDNDKFNAKYLCHVSGNRRLIRKMHFWIICHILAFVWRFTCCIQYNQGTFQSCCVRRCA